MQIALLVAAGVLFVGAFVLRGAKADRPIFGWLAFGAGIVVATAAFIVPRATTPSNDAALQIVAPEDGATVSAGRPVVVEVVVENGRVARSAGDVGAGHLHVFVDGEVQQMPYSLETRIRLPAGDHEIAVEYVDPQHISFDPQVLDRIEVVAR